jgi:hypothetical protein
VIERVVLIKLKPEYANDAQRAAIAEATATTLRDAAGVRALRVCTAADARTRREWDVCIEVVLDDLDAVERYRVDPVHRAYADVFLKPLMDRIRVYNFERTGEVTIDPPTGPASRAP